MFLTARRLVKLINCLYQNNPLNHYVNILSNIFSYIFS